MARPNNVVNIMINRNAMLYLTLKNIVEENEHGIFGSTPDEAIVRVVRNEVEERNKLIASWKDAK